VTPTDSPSDAPTVFPGSPTAGPMTLAPVPVLQICAGFQCAFGTSPNIAHARMQCFGNCQELCCDGTPSPTLNPTSSPRYVFALVVKKAVD
jgi:hypothetical protein